MNLTKRHTAVSSGASFRRRAQTHPSIHNTLALTFIALSLFLSSLAIAIDDLATWPFRSLPETRLKRSSYDRYCDPRTTEFFRYIIGERVFTLALAQTHAKSTVSNCSRRDIQEAHRIRKVLRVKLRTMAAEDNRKHQTEFSIYKKKLKK